MRLLLIWGGEFMIKMISWNVNGLRAIVNKGFIEEFKNLDADIFCIQETKLQQNQIKIDLDGYDMYWNYAEKKGYSGTAIFTRIKPVGVSYGMGIDEHDHEGRIITLEFENFYLVCVYTPNSQNELKRLDYRMKWEDDFREFLNEKKIQSILSIKQEKKQYRLIRYILYMLMDKQQYLHKC